MNCAWLLSGFFGGELCLSSGELSGDSLSSGELSGDSLSRGELSGDSLSSGELSGDSLSSGELSSDSLSSGELSVHHWNLSHEHICSSFTWHQPCNSQTTLNVHCFSWCSKTLCKASHSFSRIQLKCSG